MGPDRCWLLPPASSALRHKGPKAYNLCLVLWMEPLQWARSQPWPLPLSILQFGCRSFLSGPGLERNASTSFLHIISEITTAANLYWVLTISVRLEPLSSLYKWRHRKPLSEVTWSHTAQPGVVMGAPALNHCAVIPYPKTAITAMLNFPFQPWVIWQMFHIL